jgi:hypothetical protein
MVMDLDGAIHSDLDMGDLDTGIWLGGLGYGASDGIILTTATITLWWSGYNRNYYNAGRRGSMHQ